MNIISIIALIVVSTSSFAFTVNSSTNPNLKGWDGADVQLLVNTANCPAGFDVVGIIESAVSVWNNVPDSKIKVSYGGSTTSTTFASLPTVYCEVNFQSVTGADQNSVPGAAAVLAPSGTITQGLLFLNASAGQANVANFDSTTLKIILAHEIGHILGLGHSETTNALMYFDASAKTKLSLAQDDMDGMSYLYPSNELSDSKKILGCGLVKNAKPPTRGSAMALLLFLMLPILLIAQGRKKV